MKICLINNSYGLNARGGAEKIIAQVAAELKSRGDAVTIIAGSAKNIAATNFNGVRVIYLRSNHELNAKRSMARRLASHIFGFINLANYWRFKKVVAEEKFALIWTHNLSGFGLSTFCALGQAHKLHSFHDIQLLHPSGLLIYEQEKKLDTLIAKIYRLLVQVYFKKELVSIFPSAWLKDLHNKYLPLKHTKLIHNPQTDNQDIKAVAEGPEFLFVGQLEEHKGVELLIKSFLKIKNQTANLWIVGSGSLENFLRTTYNNAKITFLGKMDFPLPIMKAAKCLVVPSLCYENYPTVILEAQSVNTPVIGSKLGGIPEAIASDQLTFIPTTEACTKLLDFVLDNYKVVQITSAEIKKQQSRMTVIEYLQVIKKLISF